MGQCFSVGSKKGNIKKIDRVVEYVHYAPNRLEIYGDFFVTNDTDELDYLGVIHPGDVEVSNCTWQAWVRPEDNLSSLFTHLHRECDRFTRNETEGYVAFEDKMYKAGPIGPEPCVFKIGGDDSANTPFTKFKLGPILSGSYVVRVKLEISDQAYKGMVGSGRSGSQVNIFGGDALIDDILKKPIHGNYMEELQSFKRDWRRDIGVYEVIVYDDDASNLPEIQSSPDTTQPNIEMAKSKNCLWFMANKEKTGDFTIRLVL